MSRLLFNHSGISADSFGFLLGLSRLLSGDVIEGLQVQAKTSPGMSITVGQGSAGISSGTYPDNFRYWIANDTTSGSPVGESVTITTASASNPRIDTIVAYVNESATFSTSPANFPGGWTAAAVAGTPAGSPSAPSGATIQAAVGAGNPYIILADVLVGTSVTQINSGNITDRRTFAQITNQNVATNRLGLTQITSSFSTTSTTPVQVTSLTTTVTIPSGGRPIRITAHCPNLGSSASGKMSYLSIWDGTVGSGTQLTAEGQPQAALTTPFSGSITISAIVTPTAGVSKTYNVGLASDGGGSVTAWMTLASTAPAYLLVEPI